MRRMRRPAATAMVTAMVSIGCAARPPGPSHVSGRVVDQHGRPLAGVQVLQRVTDWNQRYVVTDERGEFAFPRLPLTPDGHFVLPSHPLDPMVDAPLIEPRPAGPRVYDMVGGVL